MTLSVLRSLVVLALVTGPVWSASTAQAQAYAKVKGTTSFVSAHTQSGAIKLWDALDGSSTGSRTQTVELPFPFTFYGVEYTSTTVSSRGYLTFTDNGLHYANNVTVPSADAPNAYIAPMWDQLEMWRTSSGGTAYADSKVYHHTRGVAPNRIFLVTWYRMSTPTSSTHYNAASASVELYEGSNKIKFIYSPYYENSYYGSFSWTSAIENAEGTEGLVGATCSPNCKVGSSEVSANTSYEFTPTMDLGVSQVSAPSTASAGQSVTIHRTFTNTHSAPSQTRDYTIYLSEDDVITAADTPVYRGTVGALQPSATDSTPDTFLLDVETAGTFWFGVRLDAADANASNNQSAAAASTVVSVPLAITAPATLPEAVQSIPIPTDSSNPFVFKAVGPGTTRTWSVSAGALPAGVTLAPTGMLEGMPTAPTTGHDFTVSVSNGVDTASRAYTLVVRPRLSIATTTLPEAAQASAYSAQLEVTGGPDGRTWSVISGSLPSGVTLHPSTGLISGTPSTAGTFTPTVRVSAGAAPFQQTAEVALTLVVRPRLTVSLPVGVQPPDAITGVAYSLQPVITGGTGSYAVSIVEGVLPPGLSVNASTGHITGTVSTPGQWSFNYRVQSGAQTEEKRWTLSAFDPLVLVDTTLPDAIEGTAYNHTMTATGGTATKSWTLTGTPPTGISFTSQGVFSGTPASPSGTNPRSLRINVNSGSQTVQRVFSLFVVGKLVMQATTPADAVRGKTYSFTPSVTGGVATKTFTVTSGALPPGLSLNASTGAVTGTPTQAGSYSITLQVESGQGDAYQSVSQTFAFVVYEPLEITTASLPDARVGELYGPHDLAFTGGSGSWSWSATGLPSGLTLTQAGTLSGTPTTSVLANVTVTLNRGSQTAQKILPMAVYGTLAISTMRLPDAARGEAYSFDLQATGAPTVTWSVLSGALPSGLSLSAQGRVSGTPAAGAATSTVTVQASGGNQTVTRSYTLSVYDPMKITTASLPDGVTGTSYVAQFEATGGPGGDYLWAPVNTMPAGLTLGATTGRLTGTPTASGNHTVQVRVSSGDLSGTRTFQLRIDPRLRVTTSSLPDAVKGQAYGAQLQATGGTGSFTWTALSMPAGLTLSSSGAISGTPANAGAVTVRARVSSGDQTDETTLSLSIYDPVTISTTSLPSGVVGDSYDVQLNAVGGSTARSWSVDGGSLPSGMWLTTGGRINGTPSQSGRFTFTVRVNSSTQTATRSLTLDIFSRLVITTTSLPNATKGVAYTATLAATGGAGAARWSVTGGQLPAGLTLNADSGALSGSPSQEGNSSFEVTATSGLQTARRTFTIAVFDKLTLITKTLPEGIRNRPYQAQLEAAGGGSAHAWSVSAGQLPTGVTMSASTGALSGLPATAGRFEFTVRVTSGGQETTGALSITIREPLTVMSTTLERAKVGEAFEHTFTAVGGLDDDRRWSIHSGRLPPPLTLDEATGIVAGTPILEGSFPFRVLVQSGEHTATADVTLYVEPGEQPLVVTTDRLPPAFVGVPYAWTFEADGGEPPYTWTSGALPEGFTLSEEGTLEGIATAERQHSLSFTVIDAAQKRASVILKLLVAAPEKVIVVDAALDPATVGVTYAATLQAMGGQPPYAWALTEGSLPEGLTLTAAGQVVGTTFAEPGVFAFTAQATDAAGVAGSTKFTLALGLADTLTLLTNGLPSTVAGEPYRSTLLAAGGVGPYTFSVAEGLPPGLQLDRRGVIFGSAATVGSYTFTVRVDDTTGLTTSKELSIDVSEDARAEPPGCTCAGSGATGLLLLLGLMVRRRRR